PNVGLWSNTARRVAMLHSVTSKETIMQRNLTRHALCLLVVFAGAALTLAPNAPLSLAQATSAEPSFQLASSRDRVCCRRGWQDWWTNARACRRNGGVETANRRCRNNWN